MLRLPPFAHHRPDRVADAVPDGGLIIEGRSDAVLNPGGVRIGTAEIYRQMDMLPEMIEEGRRILERAVNRFGLSARAYARILKVARTVADIAASPRVQADHLAEAIQYRAMDRLPFR
mgnify:CR=1 FL=1